MGMCTLVLGKSGSGKTTSLRNFERSEVLVLNVANKKLPFKKKLNVANLRTYNSTDRYKAIKGKILEFQDQCKCFVIDDTQYLLAFASFDKASQKGYDKFTDMAVEFKNLLDFIQIGTKDDVTIYMLHHVELDDAGSFKAKTIGKMLDSQLTIEGLFTTVIQAETEMGSYHFRVHNNGNSTVKTPLGMFDKDIIDNDLKEVDRVIREYYEMPPLKIKEAKESEE